MYLGPVGRVSEITPTMPVSSEKHYKFPDNSKSNICSSISSEPKSDIFVRINSEEDNNSRKTLGEQLTGAIKELMEVIKS